jgi:hypothetical protein
LPLARSLAAVEGIGELLGVIFSGPDPRPVHAVVRERCDRVAARRVVEAFGEAQGKGRGDVPRVLWYPAILLGVVVSLPATVAGKLRRRAPEPDAESELTLWLDASGRARAERSWESADGPRLVSVMTVGWGTGGIGPIWGRPSPRAMPTAIDVERLFDRGLLREIVAGLDLERVRDDDVAGRPVTVVRAVRRRPESLWPEWLPFGADRYELGFDREYGTLLAYTAFAGDTPYEEATATRVVYGEPIDPAILHE